MKPVRQTRRGGPDVPPGERGDCWDACLASILEVPIAAVSVPHSDDPDHHWWDETRRALEPHGYHAVCAEVTCWPDGYWIAAVPSKNLGAGVTHVIVMIDGQVAHDPGLGDRYEVGTSIENLDIKAAFVLVPREIRSFAA